MGIEKKEVKAVNMKKGNLMNIKSFKGLALIILIVIVITGTVSFIITQVKNNSMIIGYVSVLEKQKDDKTVKLFMGKLHYSSGKEELLFTFEPADVESNSEHCWFPFRFFAWGKEHVAYCGANLNELILVDY